jgi:regulation of enolase protein 1 (concanavalin A-like superfamily)
MSKDVPAGKPAAAAMPKDFDRIQARINTLITEGNLTAARDVLQRAAPAVARCPKAAEWCRQTAARLKEFEAKRTNQALLLQTARQLVDAFDYEQAQSLLAPIPAAERSASVRELLADVEQTLEELRVLEEDLVDAVRCEDLDEIKIIIDRLLELRPSHRLARQVQRNFGKIRRGRMMLTVGPTGQVELQSGSAIGSPVAVWGLAAIALIGVAIALVAPKARGWLSAAADRVDEMSNGTGQAPPAPPAGGGPQATIPDGNNAENPFAALLQNFFDPVEGTQMVATGDQATLKVAPAVHDLSIELGQMTAPRALEPVSGDFTYQVRVANVTGPEGESLLAGRRAFVGAGILVWADERNYVRLERAAMQGGLRDTIYANWELRENGRFARPGATGEMPLSGPATWLRVQRRGNQLIGSVSEDGALWKDLPPLMVKWPQDVQIGIAAVNNTPIGYEARFENRRLWTN